MKAALLPLLLIGCATGAGEGPPDGAVVVIHPDASPPGTPDAKPPPPDASTAPDGGAISTTSFTYTDPPATGKLRLVVDVASSTGTTIALKLVANATLVGYSVGFDLPLDATRVKLSATPLVPGTVLPAGSAPVAAKAALPTAGPLAGVLVVGQSQKASGTGAVAGDTTIHAGDVLLTVKLDAVSGAPAGTVFDGAALSAKFFAGMRDKSGTDVAVTADVKVGKLVKK